MFQCPSVAFKFVQKETSLALNYIRIQGLVSTHRNKVLKWYAVYLSLPGCLFHRVLDTCWWLLNKSQSQSSVSGGLCFFICRTTNWLFCNCPHLLFAIPCLHLGEVFLFGWLVLLFVLKRNAVSIWVFLVHVWRWRLTSNFAIVHVFLLESLMTYHFKRVFEWSSVFKYEFLIFYICNFKHFPKQLLFLPGNEL